MQKNPPLLSNDISTVDASKYFENFRQQMGYDKNGDLVSGYFDISKQSLAEIQNKISKEKIDQVRVYFGQDSYTKPQTNILLVNAIDSNGNEVNTGNITKIDFNIVKDHCPYYCDINTTVIGRK